VAARKATYTGGGFLLTFDLQVLSFARQRFEHINSALCSVRGQASRHWVF
jgi:hypothetical protein